MFLIVLFLMYHPAKSQDHGFGAGIIIGEPTGFSVKDWLNTTNAIDGGLAWSFQHDGLFHIHADYLWHSYNVFSTQEKIPLYYGIGGRIAVGHGDNSRIGLRMVGGICYEMKNAPFDLFVEVAPIVDFAPSTDLSGNGGIGARFYFR